MAGKRVVDQKYAYAGSNLNPNKCKRRAYISHFTKLEKRQAIIGIRQWDADVGLGEFLIFTTRSCRIIILNAALVLLDSTV